MSRYSRQQLVDILRDKFGHEDFEAGQYDALRTVLEGRDVLAVIPTGGSKSLIYQLAAQVLPGVTLVVSPLIALMKDQLDSLIGRGHTAAAISSQLADAEITTILEEARQAEHFVLYVTPERFENDMFMKAMAGLTVSLLVVDEAHCISQWGHDFRPAYGRLDAAIHSLGRPPVLALTATASPWIRQDIIQQLDLSDPQVNVHGVDRPELFLAVSGVQEEKQDFQVLERLFTAGRKSDGEAWREILPDVMSGPGIIYTATTKAAEETARWLEDRGITAGFYHGQMTKAERSRSQDAFMDGTLRVIAATNAFGMGIDKPDIRFVIHRDIPGSIEAYYQEAGRAGRDGQPALCYLIYRQGDLARAGFMTAGRDEQLKDFEQGRLAMIRQYAELKTCRRTFILNYFAEAYGSGQCGNCDNDLSPPEVITVTETQPVDLGLKTGQRVGHSNWGGGTVQHVTADSVTVLFDGHGSKQLSSELAMERGLLRDEQETSQS